MAVGISKGDFESFSTTCLHAKRSNKKGRTPKTPQREKSEVLCLFAETKSTCPQKSSSVSDTLSMKSQTQVDSPSRAVDSALDLAK